MAIGRGTNGELSRTTNLPSGAAGWTVCFWLRLVGTHASVFECPFALDGPTDYLSINVDPTTTQIKLYSNNGLGQLIVDPGTNAWVWLALKITGATTVQALHRLDTDAALTNSGNLTMQDLAATTKLWLLNDSFGEPGTQQQIFALKLWNAALSDAELWEESVRIRPKRTTSLDSYLPLYTPSGTDEGGLARNWTVGGTPSTVALQPRISRGGGGASRVYLPAASTAITGTIAATLDGLTAAGTGTLELSGSAAAIVPDLTAAASTTLVLSGTAAATLPGLDALGQSQDVAGAAAGVLDGLTAAGVATQTLSGTAAADLSGLDAAAAGTMALEGSGAAALPGLEALGISNDVQGTCAAVLDGLTAAASGSVGGDVTGTAAATLDGLTAAGTATLAMAGAAAATVPDLTAAGSATMTIAGAGAASLPGLDALGAASLAITGAGAGVLPGLVAEGYESVPTFAESRPVPHLRSRSRSRMRW